MSILNQVDYTKLRSIKFSNSNNQPYIQKPIPEEKSGTGGPDFLLRGGTLLPNRIKDDVDRITKMMFDTKSPNGLLFIAKQNILSLSDVNVQAPLKDTPLSINRRIYNPFSTITQVGLTPLGIHLSKQGLIPLDSLIDDMPSLGPFFKKESKLEFLHKKHIIAESTNSDLYSYWGGPGSVLGVGKTHIKLASDRTGINNIKYKDYYSSLSSLTKSNTSRFRELLQLDKTDDRYKKLLSNDKYYKLGLSLLDDWKDLLINDEQKEYFNADGKAKSTQTQPSPTILLHPSSLTYQQIISQSKDIELNDFRTQLIGYNKLSVDYKENNFIKRTNFDTSNTIKHDFLNSE